MVTRRAELGQWNTAAPVAQLAIAALGGIPAAARVLDPTCGDGVFLAAAIAAGARDVVGIEIDPRAAARARQLVAGVRDPGGPSPSIADRVRPADDNPVRPTVDIVVSDLLAPELLDATGGFDIALGNPPYVRAGRVDPAIKRERARVLAADWPALPAELVDAIARHADVSATCILRTLRFVRPGGRVALVVSTALLDADGATKLWTAIERIAQIEALITAPAERWFADAAVNSMLLVARRHEGAVVAREPLLVANSHEAGVAAREPLLVVREAGLSARAELHPVRGANEPRILRLAAPTREVASRAHSLDDIASASEEVRPHGLHDLARPHSPHHIAREEMRARASNVAAWSEALRAPTVWFAWRDKAHAHLVPLRELCEVRRGLTTGANDVFYVRRDEATRLGLERRFLAPVVRSPFNGAPAAIAIAPEESPIVAIAVPPDAKLARAPRIRAWFERHEAAALSTSAARRDPWWSLPVHPARLFFAKAYGPRFVQRLADVPMLADQRVYALHPRDGVDLVALAAVLNALPTALALESMGRRSMGYGAVEWTVHDAMELPVLDVRRASASAIAELHAALSPIARRPVGHVRLERDDAGRARLDRCVLAMAPGGELAGAMWDGLCASVAQRDRYLLPAV